MCASCEGEPNTPDSTTKTVHLPATGSVADQLVPDNGPIAASVNGAYTKVIGAIMTLYNSGGPRLVTEFKISASQGRGIFIMALTQMLGAVCGYQFRMRPDQQADLVAELNDVTKKHAARAQLFLPENMRMDRLIQDATTKLPT